MHHGNCGRAGISGRGNRADDDCEAAPDWLSVLVDQFVAYPRVGVVGGAVVAPPARVRGPGNCPACQPDEVMYEPDVRPGGPPPGFGWIGANFAFDRRTAQLVNCCGASLNGDTSVRQSGLVGYVFPIGTQKQTYQVYDTTLKRPMPFTALSWNSWDIDAGSMMTMAAAATIIVAPSPSSSSS